AVEEQRGRCLADPHGEVEIVELRLAGPASATEGHRAGLADAPAVRQHIDLVFVLVVLALALDPFELEEIIDLRHSLRPFGWPSDPNQSLSRHRAPRPRSAACT